MYNQTDSTMARILTVGSPGEPDPPDHEPSDSQAADRAANAEHEAQRLQSEIDSLSNQLCDKLGQLDYHRRTASCSSGTGARLKPAEGYKPLTRTQKRAAQIWRAQEAQDIVGWGLQAEGISTSTSRANPALFKQVCSEINSPDNPEMEAMLARATALKDHSLVRRHKLHTALGLSTQPQVAKLKQLSPSKPKHSSSLLSTKVKRKKTVQPSLPLNQLRSMFSEKMKAIMMQDRGLLRAIFCKFDEDNVGVLTLPQFHALLTSFGIDLNLDECREFMSNFTAGKSFMSFGDFFQNLLGFPHDFFQMKLITKHETKPKVQNELVKKLPAGTSADVLAALFVRTLRRELYDVSACMRQVLRKERSQRCLNTDDLAKLFHAQGITLNKVELGEIMAHYDFDMDGGIECTELTHELLDLPLPGPYRSSLPVPKRSHRPALGPRTKQLMELLRQQCRRSAVSHSKLDRIFTVYDKDGSGAIAYDEIQAMVKEFHLEVEGADAAAMILKKFAPSGAMSYDDFCVKVVGLPRGCRQEKKIDPEAERINPQKLRGRISDAIKTCVFTNPSAVKRAFVMFDKDAGGEISEAEFCEGFDSLKLPVKKSQVQELFRGFDTNNNGIISTHEFAQTSLGCNEASAQQPQRAATPDVKPSRAVTPPNVMRLGTPGSRASSRQGLRARAATPLGTEPRGAAAVAINSSMGTLSRPGSRMGPMLGHPTLSRLSTPVKLDRAQTPVGLVRAHTSHSRRVRPATTMDKCSTPAMLSHNDISFRPASVAG